MKAKVIKTAAEYSDALVRIEKLMDAKAGTTRGDDLELLSLLVHTYEEARFPIDQPDPITAIRFRMEQQGLRPKDLAPILGGRSKVSEVLSGRRTLSLKMIQRLAGHLGIPASVLLAKPKTA